MPPYRRNLSLQGVPRICDKQASGQSRNEKYRQEGGWGDGLGNARVQANIIVRRMVSLVSVLPTYGQTIEREASLLNLGGPRFAFRSSGQTVDIEIRAKFLAFFHVWNRRSLARGIVQALEVAGAGGHRINRRAARPTQQQSTAQNTATTKMLII